MRATRSLRVSDKPGVPSGQRTEASKHTLTGKWSSPVPHGRVTGRRCKGVAHTSCCVLRSGALVVRLRETRTWSSQDVHTLMTSPASYMSSMLALAIVRSWVALRTLEKVHASSSRPCAFPSMSKGARSACRHAERSVRVFDARIAEGNAGWSALKSPHTITWSHCSRMATHCATKSSASAAI